MKLCVSPDSAGQRLDAWLTLMLQTARGRHAGRLADVSRSRVQALIKAGGVAIRGRRVTAHTRVEPGMAVEVNIEIPRPATRALLPENIEVPVIFEDSDIIVVNKPPGLVVHPAPGHYSGTLVNALLYRFPELADSCAGNRAGIVHRLDKDTSGVMVVAKNERAMSSLANQFKHGAVRKEYLAVLSRVPRPAAGAVETLIGRSRRDRKKMQAFPLIDLNAGSPDGGKGPRRALSTYEVVEVFADACLARVRIHTGRTHQIRVHMAHIGCPVLGDRQYGGRDASVPEAGRQMLHAEIIAFTHPVKSGNVQFRADIPDDMRSVLDALRTGGLKPET